MVSINYEIERATPIAFRKAYIKRRNVSDGKYESSWMEITTYIKNWGEFSLAVDDVRINRITHSGMSLVVRNDEGKFNPETSQNSFWFGYLTRYRTLIKIEAGYTQDDGTNLPADSTMGIFYIDGEINIDSNLNEATLTCKALTSIFQEVQASDIDGIYASTLTASDIIAKIRDMSDGAGSNIFREVITSTAWTIQTTMATYVIPAAANLQQYSVWDLINILAEAEGFITSLKRTGEIEFRDRSARTTSSQFSLYGDGFPNPSVIAINWRREAIDKYFSIIRLKFIDSDTTTSYVQAGTSTIIDSSNPAWKYGSKTLNLTNIFVSSTANAQAIVNARYIDFSTMKQELQIKCKFIPHLEISDNVDLSWTSYALTSRLWDTEDWASDGSTDIVDGLSWDPETGENFDYNASNFKILSKNINLDDFTTTFVLREI